MPTEINEDHARAEDQVPTGPVGKRDNQGSNYVKERDDAIALSTELHKASAQEYDKQIVYIAGGGLALTLTFAKDIVNVTGSHFILLLILSWITFATSLLCNLISHRKATEVYSLTRAMHLYLRNCTQPNNTYEKSKHDQMASKVDTANWWLLALNRVSEWTIVIGIGAFIVFGALNVYMTASESSTTSKTSLDSERVDKITTKAVATDSIKLKNRLPPKQYLDTENGKEKP